MPRSSSIKNRKATPFPSARVAGRGSRFFQINNQAGKTPTIQLFGEIGMPREGGWFWDEEGGAGTFKEFCEALDRLGDVPEIRVEIHSCGGSVIVGKAIHDKLAEHSAKKTAVIYGICASAATYPALACDEVQIPANSFFLIHDSTACECGTAEDMQRMADALEVCDESIAALYAARTGMSTEEIRDIMRRDTWMTGQEAFDMGLADVVIDPVTIPKETQPVAQNLTSRALASMPANAAAWFDKQALANARRARALPPAALMKTSAANTVTPPAPAPAPAPAVTAPAPAPAVVVPVVENITTPTETLLEPPDIADIVKNAVTEAVKPLQEKLADLENKQKLGITAQNLTGAAPVTDVIPTGESGTRTREQFRAMNAAERAAFVRSGGKLTD